MSLSADEILRGQAAALGDGDAAARIAARMAALATRLAAEWREDRLELRRVRFSIDWEGSRIVHYQPPAAEDRTHVKRMTGTP
jgi:hypothetical protein